MISIKDLYKVGRGPSSSHTMGPASAAKYIIEKHPNFKQVEITLFNSLALTGEGHLTYQALKEELKGKKVTFFTVIDEKKHPNTLLFKVYQDQLLATYEIQSIGGGQIIINNQSVDAASIYPHKYLNDIIKFCDNKQLSFFKYVKSIEKDIESYLSDILTVMLDSVKNGLEKDEDLPGKLKVKRRAKHLFNNKILNETAIQKEKRLISSYAFAVSEENASGGQIVTAPTCGACGIVPAILYHLHYNQKINKEKLIEGLAVAGLIGNLIKHNASISGAQAGCQAEIGSACSMAAAMLAHINGYSLKQIEYAAEIAMEHHLGLTCDPVNGYVQVPCIERNAVAALRAIDASDLSYLLSDSSIVAFDTVIETMYQTGLDMHSDYKETAIGGLAYHVKEDKNGNCW